MTIQEITEQVRRKAANATPFEATAKIVTDQGVVYIDGNQSPVAVSNDDKPADCELQVSVDNLVKLGTGDLNPMMAVMSGKLKVKGDMGIAMKMGQIMG